MHRQASDGWEFTKSKSILTRWSYGLCGRSSLPHGRRDELVLPLCYCFSHSPRQELCFTSFNFHMIFPPNCSSRTCLVSHLDTDNPSYSGASHVSIAPLFQTKQHVYYRWEFCWILCTVFLISWTLSALDGSLWQGSAHLEGSTLHILPTGETMTHLGKTRPCLGPSQCICSSAVLFQRLWSFSVGLWTSQKPSSPQAIV